MSRNGTSHRRSGEAGSIRSFFLIALALGLVATLAGPALATHYQASLEGSFFEIDNNANLKVDSASGFDDWASIAHTGDNPPEKRQTDAPTGQNDDSYAGGTKEDDACPGTGTGSIPNNKSDLLNFGAYVEEGDPGFLHLFWSRVAEPSGTTLMDFELNQSGEDCGNGVNNVRTGDGGGPLTDDLLIEYRIEQGGARALIFVREWTGSAWSSATELTASGLATGTINTTSIPATESDGLGARNARTFGEMSINLDFIFDPDKCASFGSAFLKSRASTSFTSQLKDFIAPQPIDLTNCGKVIIRKVTDPADSDTSFDFSKTFGTDPATGDTFALTGVTTDDANVITFNNVLFGEDYEVTEDTPLPTGWDFVDVDCDASTGVTADITDRTVTFDIDDESDVLDCTYTNRARGSIVVEKITEVTTGSFDFTSNSLTPAAFTLTTSAAGAGGKATQTFADLAPGTYDVAETVTAGWNLDSATCDDGSDPASIGLSGGETVTCTFTNSPQTGAIEITKTRKHAADGSGDHPHPGVEFTVTGNGVNTTVATDANGIACVDGLLLSQFGTDYTVTETLPSGYQADGALAKTVSVIAESTCGDGNEATVSFANTPLTDITVSVDSQVDGGTASTIDCGDGMVSTDPDGDGSLTESDLPPGTYTCTIVIDP